MDIYSQSKILSVITGKTRADTEGGKRFFSQTHSEVRLRGPKMKRAKASLVSYSSSEDELLHNDTSGEAVTLPPAAKKRFIHFVYYFTISNVGDRKLPQISDTIVTPVPVDDPKLHQGRIRATPHVDGQFAAYVYVSLAPSRRSLLCKILQDILSDAKAIVPTLSEVWAGNDDSDRPELHISLSRPIFLRAHQREDFKRAVKNMAKTQRRYMLNLVFTLLNR